LCSWVLYKGLLSLLSRVIPTLFQLAKAKARKTKWNFSVLIVSKNIQQLTKVLNDSFLNLKI